MFTDYARARMEVCRTCEHYNSLIKTCGICGCFMPAKTNFKDQECPDSPRRWEKIVESNYDPSPPGCCGKV